MKKCLLLACLFCLAGLASNAQMVVGNDTLFGNEWLKFGQPYFKIQVADDGIFRIAQPVLAAAGFPSATPGSQFQLFHNGEEQPIFVSTNGFFGAADFVEFIGQKNRAQLDRHLFFNQNSQLNPDYAVTTDTASYFLTWTTASQPLRFQNTPNDVANPPAAEPFVWATTSHFFTNEYIKERLNSAKHRNSYFNNEGWASHTKDSIEWKIATPGLFSGGPAARLRVHYLADILEHQIRISHENQLLGTDNLTGSSVRVVDFELPAASLVAENRIKITDYASGEFSKTSVGASSISYSHGLDFEGKNSFHFRLNGTGGPQFLPVSNFSGGGGEVVLLDVSTKKRLVGSKSGGLVNFGLSGLPTGENEFWLASSTGGIRQVSSLSQVVFQDFKPANSDFVLLTHSLLFEKIDGKNWVQEWADYRSSMVGGGHNSLIVNVQDVYDQFGWGVNRHPQAIRNFIQFAVKNWPAAHFLTLVGKPRPLPETRTTAQMAAESKLFLLPSCGEPIADNLLAARTGELVPRLSLGRIAAQTASDVRDYFLKIKEYEDPTADPQTIDGQAWKKQVMHISGGDPTILNQLRGFVADFENILENSTMGAEVTTFSKTSTDPIQTSPSAGIAELFKKGVRLFTIFGHSNSNGFDYYIEPPENPGRYPLVFGFGCYSGNCAIGGRGFGERYTLRANAGGIGAFATSGYGYLTDLHPVGQNLFEKIGTSMHGQSIGDIWRATVAQMARPLGEVVYNQLLQQFIFQGDPAVRVNAAPGPDYVIDPASVVVSPNPVSIERDSFEVSFDLLNLGQNRPDSVFIELQQRRPDGQTTVMATALVVPKFWKTAVKISVSTPKTDKMSYIGWNRLLLTVDSPNKIEELPAAAEFNNQLIGPDGQAGVDAYFFGNDVMPVRPADLSIWSDKKVSLAASTLNPLQTAQKFFWEIDTTRFFNSPLLRKHESTEPGGLLEWSPTGLPMLDSTVYFWRISRDTIGQGLGFAWHDQSFLYKNDSPDGWNENHYFQYLQNVFLDSLYIVDTSRLFSFGDYLWPIGLYMGSTETGGNYVYYKSQSLYSGTNPFVADVVISVFDSITELIEIVPVGHPNNLLSDWQYFYSFHTKTEAGRKKLMDFLTEIPNGKFAVLTANSSATDDYQPGLWAIDSVNLGSNIFQVLEKIGAKSIRNQANLPKPQPYAFVFKKGSQTYQPFEIGWPADTLSALIEVPLWFKKSNGALVTPPIGPAKKWAELDWKLWGLDPSDFVSLDLFGLKKTGGDTLLMEQVLPGKWPLGAISAIDFPMIRLKMYAFDPVLHTAPQVEKLRVLFEAMPEGGVELAGPTFFEKDTVEQGEPLKIAAQFRHIDGGAMDSLLVKFTVRDAANQETVFSKREKVLPVGDSVLLKTTIPTAQLAGGNPQFSLEVNPDSDQPERHHFNNVLVQNFTVRKDKINPLLDVTFDGQHLLNGDLVSPKPEIFITLKDENRWLTMSDSAGLQIEIVLPPDSSRRVFHLDGSDPDAQFFPATTTAGGKKNQAEVRLTPHFTVDGHYELQVKGQDRSGNESGSVDWKINFEVITKSSISNLLNYPNPFSTRTCFHYTLTGEEIPTHFRLRIMTVSGKIVREITEGEFGPLLPGRHLSAFCWDGRDEFGDQLANGVYLYKIVAKKSDGSDFEAFENKAVDGFFKNGWGKMVLIR